MSDRPRRVDFGFAFRLVCSSLSCSVLTRTKFLTYQKPCNQRAPHMRSAVADTTDQSNDAKRERRHDEIPGRIRLRSRTPVFRTWRLQARCLGLELARTERPVSGCCSLLGDPMTLPRKAARPASQLAEAALATVELRLTMSKRMLRTIAGEVRWRQDPQNGMKRVHPSHHMNKHVAKYATGADRSAGGLTQPVLQSFPTI